MARFGNILCPSTKFSERRHSKRLGRHRETSSGDPRPRLPLAYALNHRFRAFLSGKFQALGQACNSRILTAKLPPAVIGRISLTGAFLPCSYSIVPSVPQELLSLHHTTNSSSTSQTQPSRIADKTSKRSTGLSLPLYTFSPPFIIRRTSPGVLRLLDSP